jgi:flagellar biosynthesis component FlhA
MAMHIILALPFLGLSLAFVPPIGALLTALFVAWLLFGVWRDRRRRRKQAALRAKQEALRAQREAARLHTLAKALQPPR